MNHGRDFFMQEYRKVVLLCESWSQYHLSYSTSSLRFVPCDQPQEKRESGTTFFIQGTAKYKEWSSIPSPLSNIFLPQKWWKPYPCAFTRSRYNLSSPLHFIYTMLLDIIAFSHSLSSATYLERITTCGKDCYSTRQGCNRVVFP